MSTSIKQHDSADATCRAPQLRFRTTAVAISFVVSSGTLAEEVSVTDFDEATSSYSDALSTVV